MRFALLGLVLGSLLVVGGCSDSSTSAAEPVVIVIPPQVAEELPLVIIGSVVDKISGNVIDGAQVSFIEGEAEATNITDLDGQALSSLTATGGSFQVTPTNDITEFTIVATADGYISDSVEISFDSSTESLVAQVSLLAQASEGVAVKVQETVVVAATVAETITITTEESSTVEDTTEGSAEVVIPVNVELQDSEGNPVSGTTLKVEVTYVETQQASVDAPEEEVVTIASIIPEGLNTDTDQAPETVLIPIGVAEINMTDENNTEIKKFSSPITITINLPSDTQIPSVNRTVTEGDNFTVRSYDEETNEWATEPNLAVVGAPNEANVHPANLRVDHLTFFALTDAVTVCESDINFDFSSDGDDIPVSGLKFSVKSNDIDRTITIRSDTSVASISASEAKLIGIAADASASIAVKDFEGKSWYSSNGEVALCGETISVVLANPVVAIDESLAITVECSNDSTIKSDLENALVTYQANAGSIKFTAQETTPGSYALVELDTAQASYLVSVDTRTDAVADATTSVTPNGEDESLELSLVCDSTTGTGSN